MSRSFIRNLLYAAGSKYLGIVIGLVIMGILARLLPPRDFGVMGIGSVFITFFGMTGEMGLAPAVVRFQKLTADNLRSLFGFTCWIALFSATLFFFFSNLVGWYYDSCETTRVCRWLAILLFFAIVNIVPQNLLIRQKRFDIIARRVLIIQVTMGGASVAAACRGWGIDALLLSQIGTMVLTFLANTYSARLTPKLFFDREPVRIVSSFSIYQFLFNLIGYIAANIDRLVIAKILTLPQLAYFDKSRSLSSQPVHNIGGVISSVIYPYLSELQDDKARLKQIYSTLLGLFFLLSFPIAAFCIGSASELILLIFGRQWTLAVIPFSILSVGIIAEIPHVMEGTMMQACNQTDKLFRLGLIKSIVALLILFSTVIFRGTLQAICISSVVTSFVVVSYSIAVVYRRCFDYRLSWRDLRILVLPLGLFTVILIALTGVSLCCESLSLLSGLLIKVALTLMIVWGGFEFFSPYKPSLILKSIAGNGLRLDCFLTPESLG